MCVQYTVHIHVAICTSLQYCSEYVLQAIQERDGIDMLTALVDSGADINLPTSDGSYPIHEAVAARQHEVVLFLLNREARVKQQRSVRITILVFLQRLDQCLCT